MANGDIEVTIEPADWLTEEIMRQIKRQALCPYCHKGKPIVDDNIAFVGFDSDTGELWFNSDKFVGHDEAAFVNIAYCPMCGRRLDDKNL